MIPDPIDLRRVASLIDGARRVLGTQFDPGAEPTPEAHAIADYAIELDDIRDGLRALAASIEGDPA